MLSYSGLTMTVRTVPDPSGASAARSVRLVEPHGNSLLALSAAVGRLSSARPGDGVISRTGVSISPPEDARQKGLPPGCSGRAVLEPPSVARPYRLATDTEMRMLAEAVGPGSGGAFAATGQAMIETRQAAASRRLPGKPACPATPRPRDENLSIISQAICRRAPMVPCHWVRIG